MTEEKEKKLKDIRKEADAIKCVVRQALYLVEEFLEGPMCGKCFPCEMGAYEARVRLEGLVAGSGRDDDIDALRRIADHMALTSRCKKGKDVAGFLHEWLGSEEFSEHLNRVCRTTECTALMKYLVIPEKCTVCGECQEVCKDNAVIGEKKLPFRSGYLPFEISQKRCTKCGECIKVCPSDAIEFVGITEKTEEEVQV
jgi:NAD-dependent dihydropyrimidine dehydrogenase PreA subunit